MMKTTHLPIKAGGNLGKAAVSQPDSIKICYTRSLLARNTIYNLAGHILPLLVAFVTIPYLINGMGMERFGVLAIAWMVVGYFSIFDLGIGRATTKFVAEYTAVGETERLPSLIWTSLLLLLAIGLFAGAAAAAMSSWLVTSVLNIPSDLVNESRRAFLLLSWSIPLTLVISGTRGILEARQRFGLINAIKIPANSAAFVFPLVVLFFSKSLYPIVAALVAGRVIVFVLYLYFSLQTLPELRRPRMPGAGIAKEILRFGGWLTVSNIISPIMVYMDRFLLGAILTMSAVAFYVTPYELITKLTLIAGSLLGVLFPVFSSYSKGQREKIALLFNRSVGYLLAAITPLVIAVIVLADPFLNFWLGPEFASESTLVLQLLAMGVLVNSVAFVPFGAIQALGRPDWTAKLHMLELPLYLAILWFLTQKMGIVGCALAWVMRATFDTIILFLLARNLIPAHKAKPWFNKVVVVVAVPLLFGVSYLISNLDGIWIKTGFLLIIFSLMAVGVRKYVLDDKEKSFVRNFVDGFFGYGQN